MQSLNGTVLQKKVETAGKWIRFMQLQKKEDQTDFPF